MLTVGSLFSGIGGIDLGLERAGMKVRWQVEIDEWCRAVLAKHWPDVERFADVKEVGAHNLAYVDVIAGGFPCQDLSYAGKGAGLAGERSGLWYEYARIVRELRPRYVLVENVPGLLARGMGVVLGDLAACGYDAEWDCIPAAAVGAPHRRDRVWIIAYPGSVEHESRRAANERTPPSRLYETDLADTDGGLGRRTGRPERPEAGQEVGVGGSQLADADDGGRVDGQAPVEPAERGLDALGQPVAGRSDVADSESVGHERAGASRTRRYGFADGGPLPDTHGRGCGTERIGRGLDEVGGRGSDDAVPPSELRAAVPDAEGDGRGARRAGRPAPSSEGEVEPIESLEDPDGGSVESWRGRRGAAQTGRWWWRAEPNVGRVAHGIPARVDRLRGLGNAVVPQVVEWIGRRIVEAEAHRSAA